MICIHQNIFGIEMFEKGCYELYLFKARYSYSNTAHRKGFDSFFMSNYY